MINNKQYQSPSNDDEFPFYVDEKQTEEVRHAEVTFYLILKMKFTTFSIVKNIMILEKN